MYNDYFPFISDMLSIYTSAAPSRTSPFSLPNSLVPGDTQSVFVTTSPIQVGTLSITDLLSYTLGQPNGDQYVSNFVAPPSTALNNTSITGVLYTALGHDVLGNFIPYLSIPNLPTSNRSSYSDARAGQFNPNTNVGQASFTIVDVQSNIGYYGQADAISYGLYPLDSAGYPAIDQPYLNTLSTQADIPTSQLSSQIVAAVNSLASSQGTALAQLVDLATANNVLLAQILAAQQASLTAQAAQLAETTAQTTELTAIAAAQASLVASSLAANVLLASIAASSTDLTPVTNLMKQLLAVPAPQILKAPTDGPPLLQTSQPIPIAEVLFRGLFATNPLSFVPNDPTQLNYVNVPYLSANAPLQPNYSLTRLSQTVPNPTGKSLSTPMDVDGADLATSTGQFYAQTILPDFPAPLSADSMTDLTGVVDGISSSYTSSLYDPFSYIDGAGLVVPSGPMPTQLYVLPRNS